MITILVTGTQSYIGNSFAEYLSTNFGKNKYRVEKVSLRSFNWKKASWSEYNTVLHVAGIAHVDTKNASEETKQKYYEINTDLTIEAAKKAKEDGVSQFVFLSSMIVYGDSAPIGKDRPITKETVPSPAGFYGDSKLQAEAKLLQLEEDNFKITIVRPPMVYGKGSKGNYPRLAKMAKKTPVFPKIKNQRSMIYIENLCELLRLLMENGVGGTFHPQNKEIISTTELVRAIANSNGHKIWFLSLFNSILRVMGKGIGMINKIFGNFYYDQSLSEYVELDYQIFDLSESIFRTEEKECQL